MHSILKSNPCFEKKSVEVDHPLMKGMRTANYLVDHGNKTAYIEVANSAGLQMLENSERDPFKATSIVSAYK